jgi:hypothetical protein
VEVTFFGICFGQIVKKCVSIRNTALLMLLLPFSFAGPGFEASLIEMVVADLGG